MVAKKTLQQRLEEKFRVTPGCWLWTAAKHPKGYGLIGIGQKLKYAHRAAYELYVGSIADGMLVCHRCDNPGCVNPDHLFLGSSHDNTSDMMSKGRNRNKIHAGAENGFSKLTEESVIAIKKDDRPLSAIAKQFGISTTTAARIKHGLSWKHIHSESVINTPEDAAFKRRRRHANG